MFFLKAFHHEAARSKTLEIKTKAWEAFHSKIVHLCIIGI
jgi:hypothetical protein